MIVAYFIWHNICVKENLPPVEDGRKHSNHNHVVDREIAVPQANPAGVQVRRELIVPVLITNRLETHGPSLTNARVTFIVKICIRLLSYRTLF